MIPYFQFTDVSLGPFTLHVWGVMAAIGFLAATIVAAQRARLAGINPEHIWAAAWQVVIASIIGSRMFEVLFYEPTFYFQHPAKTIALWEGGLSSTGGIIGGALALLWYIRRHHLEPARFLDIFAFAAPLGLMFGRIGCFFIHDHPGNPTKFFLGVGYPDGIRHDGGLEMAIADGLMFLFFFALRKKKLPTGLFALLFIALKGVARFWLDFYRATSGPIVEAHYFGLTPSQYVGIAAMVISSWFIVHYHSRNQHLFSNS